MNFTQIRKLNALWMEREELKERVTRLENALMLLATTIDERIEALEQDRTHAD